mmetsp:Transcript_19673/g.40028  ORF Transcript_19673/g.40028 Transcript_19673/m.40028 type:complete len:315 (+) Transcript_19673:233-1177(+)
MPRGGFLPRKSAVLEEPSGSWKTMTRPPWSGNSFVLEETPGVGIGAEHIGACGPEADIDSTPVGSPAPTAGPSAPDLAAKCSISIASPKGTSSTHLPLTDFSSQAGWMPSSAACPPRFTRCTVTGELLAKSRPIGGALPLKSTVSTEPSGRSNSSTSFPPGGAALPAAPGVASGAGTRNSSAGGSCAAPSAVPRGRAAGEALGIEACDSLSSAGGSERGEAEPPTAWSSGAGLSGASGSGLPGASGPSSNPASFGAFDCSTAMGMSSRKPGIRSPVFLSGKANISSFFLPQQSFAAEHGRLAPIWPEKRAAACA